MEDRDLTGVLYALTIFVTAALWSCEGKPTAIESPQTTINEMCVFFPDFDRTGGDETEL